MKEDQKAQPALTKEQIEGLSFNQEKLNTQREYTPSEMDALREQHTQLSLDHVDLDDQRKEVVADFKRKIDAVKQEKARVLNGIRFGLEEIEATVFCVANTTTGMIDLYDTKNYELLSSRRARPDEREHMSQLSIIHPDQAASGEGQKAV